MVIEFETRRQDVTANAVTVTLTLDEETCFQLAHALQELGLALSRARRVYNGQKTYKAMEPWRKTQKMKLRDAIAARLEGLKLPGRKAASVIAREFEMAYDSADFLVSEIRRDGRREAARSRDETVMQLSKSGLSAGLIAERLNLSPGTVRNALSRLKRTSARQAPGGARDALRCAAE